jgi:hypothetical protein
VSATSSLVVREEHALKKVENEMLRRIFESERSHVRGRWRKLHHEVLHNSHCSQNISLLG